MEQKDNDGVVRPVLKPTRWLSSSPALLARLGKKCPSGTGSRYSHKHVVLFGKKKTQAAAEYPPELCRQILLGAQDQLKREAKAIGPFLGNLMKKTLPVYDLSNSSEKLEVVPDNNGDQYEDWEPNTLGKAEYSDEEENNQETPTETITTDSVTGDVLPADLVRKAHDEEIEFMDDWKVGELVPTATARLRTGKPPLRGKWVDVNKQDD